MRRCTDIVEAVMQYDKAFGFIFDMDGLLFDTERLFMEQLAIVMKEQGYHLTKEVYCRSLGLAGEALERLMKDVYGEEYPFVYCSQESQKRVCMVAETVGLAVKPGIRKVLEWLQTRNINCAVASSTATEYVETYLEKSGLTQYFSVVVGGDSVSHSKPAPDIFLLACTKLGIAPAEAVVLEDSQNGVLGAYRAGAKVICVPDLKQPEEKFYPYIDTCIVSV